MSAFFATFFGTPCQFCDDHATDDTDDGDNKGDDKNIMKHRDGKMLGRVSERTVCDPFFKHATVGYVVTWLRPVTT